MEGVKVVNITKKFGNVVAVNSVSFSVEKGEFFTLLGPSGCGKTTTLRIIAGFERPDNGEVYIGGKLVNEYPPEKRKIGFVFQNYALFPHLTVFENIAFPMRIKGMSEDKIREKVKYLLELLKLEGLEKRYPRQLSGGQQQRVALARALARDPEVLLLDEPLSNLDALIRMEVRRELKNLQRKTGITTVYVTHDQDEAFSLSDRIAVMDRGRIIALDTPSNLFENPKSAWLARFLRYKNIVASRVVNGEVEILGRRFRIDEFPSVPRDSTFITIRPDAIHISKQIDEGIIKSSEYVVFKGKMRDKLFYGHFTEIYITIDGYEVISMIPTEESEYYKLGEDVYVYAKKKDVKFLVA